MTSIMNSDPADAERREARCTEIGRNGPGTDTKSGARRQRVGQLWRAGLVVIVVGVFAQVCLFEFVDCDDGLNVYKNPKLNPVSLNHLGDLWTRPYGDMYIPVAYTAWAGVKLGGEWICPVAPGTFTAAEPFHLANLLIHVLNVLLLFAILRRLGSSDGAAALGALLFAVHPLQVESVAWVTEFRGLLSAFFSLLAVTIILKRHTPGPAVDNDFPALVPWLRPSLLTSRAGYSLALILYVLALLSKPSAVVVPFLLVVILVCICGKSLREGVVVVVPFVLLAVPAALVVRSAQPAITGGFNPPLATRLLIAGDAVWFYITKTLVPAGLALDYGRTPESVLLSNWRCLTAAVTVCAVVGLSRCLRHRAEYLAALGLFLAPLLPVLGLVPFRFQLASTTADRYAYLALLGPAFAVALLNDRCVQRRTVRIATVGVIAVLAGIAIQQSRHWRNSECLYVHLLKINPGSSIARNGLGLALWRVGRHEQAMEHFRRALEAAPFDGTAYANLGTAFRDRGESRKALVCLTDATRVRPRSPHAHNDLGRALAEAGNLTDGEHYFRQAIRFEPDHADANHNLGTIKLEQGRLEEALRFYETALSSRPDYVPSLINSGQVLGRLGRWKQAAERYVSALALEPNSASAWSGLGHALLKLSRPTEALAAYKKAVGISPETPETRNNLAIVLFQLGRCDEAFQEYEAMRFLNRKFAALTYVQQGLIRERQGMTAEAIELCRKALVHAPGMQSAKVALERLSPPSLDALQPPSTE